jgi:hypothetical protein
MKKVASRAISYFWESFRVARIYIFYVISTQV